MDTNPERHYKWGLFYYNPEDKRLIVPKRIKWMGWTFNFAHPLAAILFLLILIGAFIIHRTYQ